MHTLYIKFQTTIKRPTHYFDVKFAKNHSSRSLVFINALHCSKLKQKLQQMMLYQWSTDLS